MLGWHCTLYRDTERTIELACWQCGSHGLEWLLRELEQGHVRVVQDGGYPSVYLIRAGTMLPLLRTEPPDANARWNKGAQDLVDPIQWKGRTTIDRDALAKCEPSEWLLLETWDES